MSDINKESCSLSNLSTHKEYYPLYGRDPQNRHTQRERERERERESEREEIRRNEEKVDLSLSLCVCVCVICGPLYNYILENCCF